MKKILAVIFCMGVLFFTSMTEAGSYVLQPGTEGKDTIVVGDGFSGNNYGTYGFLTIYWSGSSPNYGLIEFDLSSVIGNVTDATLSLYHLGNPVSGASIGAYRNTSAWDEMTATWNTSPTYDPIAASVLNIADSSDSVWREWDVTNLVQGWVSSTYENYGMSVIRIDQPNPVIAIASSDYGTADFHPILSVNTIVPEPLSILLYGAGLLGIAGLKRRKKGMV